VKPYRFFSLPLTGAVVGVMVAGAAPAEGAPVLLELAAELRRGRRRRPGE